MTSLLSPAVDRHARRDRFLAAAASAALHVVVLAALAATLRSAPPSGVSPLLTRPEAAPRREVVLLPPPAGGGTPSGPPAARPSAPSSRQRPVAPAGAAGPDGADSASVGAPDDRRAPEAVGLPFAPLGPRYGDGRLWVQPLPRTPRQLAQAMAGRPVADLADSVVARLVQAYLDSIAREPGAEFARLPSWTTDIAGREFGVDGSSIVIAGVRIPAALLALLPFPVQGNYDRDKAWQEMMEIRRDIYTAARRADNLDEFKRHVRELRQETERKREFERNRRTPPDSAGPRDAPLP